MSDGELEDAKDAVPEWVFSGLNLNSPDMTTAEEWEDFTRQFFGHWPQGFTTNVLFASTRPDAVKRYRRFMAARAELPGTSARVLAALHYYAATGFSAGVLYNIESAATSGHSRAEVTDTLVIAYLHAGAKNLHYVAEEARDLLHRYPEPAKAYQWPENWDVDPDAFHAGLDFSKRDLTSSEIKRLENWYLKYLGEVPGHFLLLQRYAPRVLKEQRNRFEHAIRGGLPKQCLPLFQLDLNIDRGFEDGIRENLLLARGFGVTREQVVPHIAGALIWAGEAGVSMVHRVAGEILANWE
jgi:hypothetical protein